MCANAVSRFISFSHDGFMLYSHSGLCYRHEYWLRCLQSIAYWVLQYYWGVCNVLQYYWVLQLLRCLQCFAILLVKVSAMYCNIGWGVCNVLQYWLRCLQCIAILVEVHTCSLLHILSKTLRHTRKLKPLVYSCHLSYFLNSCIKTVWNVHDCIYYTWPLSFVQTTHTCNRNCVLQWCAVSILCIYPWCRSKEPLTLESRGERFTIRTAGETAASTFSLSSVGLFLQGSYH